MTNEDISKKRDRTKIQRIHRRNEVTYRNPLDGETVESPYYRASPTLVSGVYGKHRFRAVMMFGMTPWAFVEVDKKDVGTIKPEVVGRGTALVQQSAKGVGRAHARPNTRWVGWSYDLPTDYSPLSMERKKGKKWTTNAILNDIKRVIDAIN